ncbi:MAG: alginate export family protein [Nitrospiraceae bacterium]|nr:alginate export family protein [Nitrospiraceae bacterium]
MKKFIGLAIGFIALFGFAASAFAIHAEIPSETQAVVAKGTVQITISGDLRVRGWLKKNIASANEDTVVGTLKTNQITDGQNETYYDERVRLAVDASDGGVSGRIHLESNGGNHDVYTWGAPGQEGSNPATASDFNAKPANMNILEAWIQYTGTGLFGVGSGIKVGHMPLALGPDTLFFDHTKFGDDAIVGWVDPTPQTHIVALTIKAAESDPGGNFFGNGTSNAGDLDVYVGLVNQVLAGQNLQAYYVYANSPEYYANAGAGFPHLSVQDLGLNASGSFSGLTYKAEYDQNLGNFTKDGPLNKVETKGYALQLNLGYKLGPAGIRVMGAYGSGPKANQTDLNQFVNFLSANQYNTVVYGYQVANAMDDTNGNGDFFNQISNTEMLNLGVDLNPTADLKVALDYYYLRASKTENFTNVNNGVLGDVSHDIGSEFDVQADYAVAKNLDYFVKAGALVAGSFYSDTGFGQKKTAVVAMHGLELAF